MLDSIIQQFAGGGAQNLEGAALHQGVSQLASQAPPEHTAGALGEALQMLGGSGFGQSVAQGAQNSTPEQRNGLADTLLQAVSQGGGSPEGVLSQLGIGGQSLGAGELGALAQHVADNHPGALAQVLGGQLSGGGQGGGSGIMSVLGNPMVRHLGMQLAQKYL